MHTDRSGAPDAPGAVQAAYRALRLAPDASPAEVKRAWQAFVAGDHHQEAVSFCGVEAFAWSLCASQALAVLAWADTDGEADPPSQEARTTR